MLQATPPAHTSKTSLPYLSNISSLLLSLFPSYRYLHRESCSLRMDF